MKLPSRRRIVSSRHLVQSKTASTTQYRTSSEMVGLVGRKDVRRALILSSSAGGTPNLRSASPTGQMSKYANAPKDFSSLPIFSLQTFPPVSVATIGMLWTKIAVEGIWVSEEDMVASMKQGGGWRWWRGAEN